MQEVPNKLTHCAFRGNRHILLLGVSFVSVLVTCIARFVCQPASNVQVTVT